MRLKPQYRYLLKRFMIILLAVISAIIVFLFFNSSPIRFQKECNIEIHSIVDYTEFVKEVKGGNIEDLKIDASKVNTKKLGEYSVTYEFEDHKEVLKVQVVDTKAPEFDVQSQKIALNQTIDPSYLVKNIKDGTKTKVQFKQDYKFNKEGNKEVEVEVIDEAGNSSVKKVHVKVVKDTQAPSITASDISFVVGTKVDLKKLADVKDNLDKKPKIEIDQGHFDAQKLGTYKVTYKATDASQNQSSKTVTIRIVEKTAENEKVVYLTFDDGPSKYTPEVLKILNKYNCKATFFITGMNPSYRKYIKEAHDQGHTIGLHTYSHNYSKLYASESAYFKDLEKVGQLAKEYIGFVPKYIRFPGGGSNTISRKYSPGIMKKLTKKVEQKGYIYYDWNAENGDGYAKMEKSEMIRRATSSKAKKVMILMHDANGKQNTVDTLPAIIEYYQKRGYTFKAIDDSSIVPHQHVNN